MAKSKAEKEQVGMEGREIEEKQKEENEEKERATPWAMQTQEAAKVKYAEERKVKPLR